MDVNDLDFKGCHCHPHTDHPGNSTMHTGKLLFAQLMEHIPPMVFERCVARYGGHHKVKSFSCMDQFLCMAFAQLTFRESLRDIEAVQCRQAEDNVSIKPGLQIAHTARANANATRD